MSQPGSEMADAQHPWIGLASFTESDRVFFAGRSDEIEDLVRLVRRDNLTLLYGVSGLGKTSLVQAGLFPALREDNCLPVPIRLDHLEGAAPLATQVLRSITAAAVEARVEAPQPKPDETLWEYFHREGNHFWSPRNDLVTPFLAFDQFEEFFTLGRENPARAARAEAFISELADLVENRPSAALRDDPSRAKEFNFKPAPVKVLLSMREDYLADLDRIRSHFRALGQNRLRLLPMGERQARQVIALGESLLAPGVEDRIVKYVAGAAVEADTAEITVAPALLSLVLRELNERRLARGAEAKITSDLLDVEQHKIFEHFYLRTLQDFPEGVRIFIEDELLTASGHRNNCALDDALTRPDVTLPVLNELVNRRLLAYEDRHNTRRVELTHDVLVPVIKASRDNRLTRQALAQAEQLRARHLAQKRKQRITAALAGALALALVATIWGGYYVFVQEHRAYYRDFVKRNGFPVGLGPLTEAEARKLSPSLLLISKGITTEGWKPRWKPAFRMVALNSSLEPTTTHSIGTYLWQGESDAEEGQGDQSEKAEQLGLKKVCQWEFVSNAKGEIIYERALDRDGRMVFGLIYSPPGSGPAATRLARFVGPDGFPQLQRHSAAEYVSIHYDDGWEDRITYRDGKNLPAVGPDGAFGQSRGHNDRGQLTLLLSLDADGHNMIDNTGNCGMEISYNAQALIREQRSIGPDLKPMPVKDGWAICKNEYDNSGRLHRRTFYGLNEQPVLHKDGNHGFEVQYDEHGNQIESVCFGLDGKPILLPDGYAIWKSAYDAHGRQTRNSFHGLQGEPVLHKSGNHGWESQYDAHDNPISTTYFGLDGKPILLPGGFATMKSVYDARGKQIRMQLYGVSGEPVLHKDGHHGWDCEYDERGNQIAKTYFGLDGKPIVLSVGYAVVKKRFDSDGNELESSYFDAASKATTQGQGSLIHRIKRDFDGRGKTIREKYYGVNGEPVLHKDGNHGWEAQYDGRGNAITTTYLGLDEKPTILPEGYSTMKSVYDARGKRTRLSVYGVNGERVLHKDGNHGWEWKYDDRGNEIVRTHFGLDEKPILLPEKYATVKSVYDAHGKATRTTYYGVNDEPVLHKKGYHGWESQYDERGNQMSTTYFGLDGKPILLPDGYATVSWVYDSRGKVIQENYYGTRAEPILYKDNYHGWESQYDARGNQVSTTYFGLDGKPALLPSGFATIKWDYDSRGKQTRMSLYGVKGERVLHKDGHHGWESQYDERGNEVASTHFGLDEKPILLAAGYATVKWVYDARGKVLRQDYFGVKGEPVLYKNNYHGWESQYDARGNEIETTYFGLDGKPTLLAVGFATIKSTYDVRGSITRLSCYGLHGERVLHRDGYHAWEAKYDELGKEIEKTYFGLDGKPITLPKADQN